MSNKTILTFKASEVRRILEHSINSPEQAPVCYTHEPVSRPSLVIVHDQGVYLMSNGSPSDLIGDPSSQDRSCFCAYARGCNPDKDPDFWERSRELVGGDDFAETLQCAEDFLTVISLTPEKRVFKLEMTPNAWMVCP